MDDMNELLASKTFLHFFRRGITASQVVEVVHVDINQDYSHATAYWKSSFVNRFISFVAKEKGAELGDNVRGIEVAEKLHKQFTKLINTRLQDSESRFRSNLLKTMSFRRVPRIFFRPIAKRRGVGSGKQKSTSNGKKVYDGSANEDYMEFLRSTTVF